MLPRILLGGQMALSLLILVFLLIRWKKKLRETIYSYSNVALVAGMFFVAVLFFSQLNVSVQCTFLGKNPTPEELVADLVGYPRTFSLLALTVILMLSLLVCVSNVALVRHEGFHLLNLLGFLLGGMFLGGTLLAFWASGAIERILLGRVGDAVRLQMEIGLEAFSAWISLLVCYFESILLATAVMGWMAARHVPAYDKDFIIILGCSIDRRGGLLPLLKGRANRAVRFAWEQEIATGKPLHYVPSGGKGPDEVMSEGSALELYLLSHGAESYEVFPEKASANTRENMEFSKAIIDALKPNARVAFATTNYHIFRSGLFARRAGLDAEGIASDTKWYFWPNGFVREFFGILAINKKYHLVFAAISAALCGAAAMLCCLLLV